MGQEAVGLTPANSPSRLAPLNNLAHSLSLMYKRTNALKDLEIATLMAQEVVNAVSHDNRLDRVLCSSNLSALLRARLQRVGGLENLEQAVQCDRVPLKKSRKYPGTILTGREFYTISPSLLHTGFAKPGASKTCKKPFRYTEVPSKPTRAHQGINLID